MLGYILFIKGFWSLWELPKLFVEEVPANGSRLLRGSRHRRYLAGEASRPLPGHRNAGWP